MFACKYSERTTFNEFEIFWFDFFRAKSFECICTWNSTGDRTLWSRWSSRKWNDGRFYLIFLFIDNIFELWEGHWVHFVISSWIGHKRILIRWTWNTIDFLRLGGFYPNIFGISVCSFGFMKCTISENLSFQCFVEILDWISFLMFEGN